MGERIKSVLCPTSLSVATATTFSASGLGAQSYSDGWKLVSGKVYTPYIDGEILKIVVSYTSLNPSGSFLVSTRDTVSENIINMGGWSSSLAATIYPLVEGVLNTNGTAAAANKTNVFCRYAVKGSLVASVAAGKANDEVTYFKIYYR